MSADIQVSFPKDEVWVVCQGLLAIAQDSRFADGDRERASRAHRRMVKAHTADGRVSRER